MPCAARRAADGGHAAEPVSPKRDGHAFMGWYTESTLTSPWDFDSGVVNGDMTLYAKWELIKRRVSFTVNGGSAVQEQEVAEGAHAVEPAASGKSGYVFMGWYSDSGLSDAWDFDSGVVNGDMTLYARWVIAHTVTFRGPTAAVPVQEQEVAEGGHAAEPLPSDTKRLCVYGLVYRQRPDRCLGLWFRYGGHANMTLYARWSGTVSFNLQRRQCRAPEQVIGEGDHAC